MAKKTDELIRVAARFLISTPKSLSEGLWRGFALWALSMTFTVSYIAITDPEIFTLWLGGLRDTPKTLDQATEGTTRQKVIGLITKFVQSSNPLRVALVSQDKGIEVKLVWSSDTLNRPWPTSVDGILNSDFRPILGDLIFEECWEGSLGENGRWYVVCGLKTDQGNHAGFLIAEKEKPCEKFKGEFKLLAGQISRIIF